MTNSAFNKWSCQLAYVIRADITQWIYIWNLFGDLQVVYIFDFTQNIKHLNAIKMKLNIYDQQW